MQREYNTTTAYIWMIWLRCYKPDFDTDTQSRWQMYVYGIHIYVNIAQVWMSHSGCVSCLCYLIWLSQILGGEWMVDWVTRGLMDQDNSLYIFLIDLFSTQSSLKWKIPFIRRPQCSLCHYVGVQHFVFLRMNFSSLTYLAAIKKSWGETFQPANFKTDHYPGALHS